VTLHAELGASSSARWMNCPGSVPLARPYVGMGSTLYAAEGTAVHAMAQAALANRPMTPVGEVVDVDGIPILITQEMHDAIDAYLEVVRPLLDAADDGGVEVKVYIKSAPPNAECYGTADFVAIIGRKLVIVDLKFGKGVRVEVANNSQALFYALATYETLDLGDRIDEVEIIIVQPRIDGAERQIWTIDLLDLWIWRDTKLLPAVERIVAGDRSLQDGPWCRFCPALAICPLKHELAMQAAAQAFDDDPSPSNTDDISEEELATRLQLVLRLSDYIDALKEEATVRIHRGFDVPGFKLVEGRSNRKWADNDEGVIRELMARGGFSSKTAESFYTPPTLQSPAQLEKTLKRMRQNPAKLMEGLINKPPGKPALVPDNDPRPAMTVLSAREAFRLSAEEEEV
jgi:Protein of unknown function (DUF2800)